MRRICIFCEEWKSGGIESFIYTLLTHVDLTDLEVDIVAEHIEKSVFTMKLKGRAVFRELSGSTKNIIRNYAIFSKIMEERKYDVLHLNVFQALPLIYLPLAKRKGISVRIVHTHNAALRESKAKVFKSWMHKAARSLFEKDATDLWACSKNAAQFMFSASLLKEKSYSFIPNSIELERFRFDPAARDAVRKRLNLKHAFIIGNVGRLCYQKNQSFLLDVLTQIRSTEPDTYLLLVGEGELLAELKEKANRLCISDNVIFYGTSDCVEKMLCAMDVFVFPSIFEGFGTAAIEAQAVGLPVVCSECIPPEATITECIYRLPLDVGAKRWSDAILYARGYLSMGNPILKGYREKFDIQVSSQRILQFYQG